MQFGSAVVKFHLGILLLTVGAAYAGPATAGDTRGAAPAVVLQPVFPNLDTRPPATALPGNFAMIDARRVRLPTLTAGVPSAPTWIVALRNGRMFVVRDALAAAPGTPLLRDIDPVWVTRDLSQSEEGYFAVAVDPDAGTNPGRAFVYYTLGKFGGVDLLRAPIVTAARPGGGFDYTFGSPTLVLRAAGGGNHYGGHLAFGPDGFLYFAVGENNIFDRVQSPNNTMGKILRIDVHQAGLTPNYGVPADNPWRLNGAVPNPACSFATSDSDLGHACPEVFAVGFRNPFRFSFDRTGGALWLGDVGASNEELDRVTIGANYGWDTCEGTTCVVPGLVPAVTVIPRDGCTSFGYAVIGGFVYRGAAFPQLQGTYIAGDNAAGKLWLVEQPYGTPAVSILYNGNCTDTGFQPAAFSEDENGELYVASFSAQPGRGLLRIALSDTLFANGFE